MRTLLTGNIGPARGGFAAPCPFVRVRQQYILISPADVEATQLAREHFSCAKKVYEFLEASYIVVSFPRRA